MKHGPIEAVYHPVTSYALVESSVLMKHGPIEATAVPVRW